MSYGMKFVIRDDVYNAGMDCYTGFAGAAFGAGFAGRELATGTGVAPPKLATRTQSP